MIRANVMEDQEATMARFMSGLNRDIANVVELQHYLEMNELVDKKAMKVERKIRMAKYSRGGVGLSPYTKNTWTKQEGAYKSKTETITKSKAETPKEKQASVSNTSRGISEPSSIQNRYIKCFKCLGKGHIARQCPNKKVMIINTIGDYETEEKEEEEMPSLEESDEEVEYPVEAEALVVRRALNAQFKEEESSPQRETIFHTCCWVKDKMCFMIIYGWSCANVASTYMVEKLRLRTMKQPRPYRLQWLNDCG